MDECGEDGGHCVVFIFFIVCCSLVFFFFWPDFILHVSCDGEGGKKMERGRAGMMGGGEKRERKWPTGDGGKGHREEIKNKREEQFFLLCPFSQTVYFHMIGGQTDHCIDYHQSLFD